MVGRADPAHFLLIALAVEAALSGVPGIPRVLDTPRAMVAGLVLWFDRRLNRPRRSPANRRARGVVVVAIIAALALLAAWALAGLAHMPGIGQAIELVVLVCLLIQGRPMAGALAAARHLARDDTAAAARALARMVADDTTPPDAQAVARGVIAALVTRLCTGVVAPALYYLVFGLAGALLYRCIAEAAERIGRDSNRHRAFGLAAAGLRDALDAPAVLIAGPLLSIAAAVVPGARPLTGFATMLGPGKTRRPVAAGWMQGAAAGGLGLALGGPVYVDGETVAGPWLGDGRARATAADVRRAVMLYAVACLLTIGLVGVLVLAEAL